MTKYALFSGESIVIQKRTEEFFGKNSISGAILSAPASVFYEKEDEIIKSIMDLMNVQKTHYVIRLRVYDEDNFVKAAINDGIDCIIYDA